METDTLPRPVNPPLSPILGKLILKSRRRMHTFNAPAPACNAREEFSGSFQKELVSQGRQMMIGDVPGEPSLPSPHRVGFGERKHPDHRPLKETINLEKGSAKSQRFEYNRAWKFDMAAPHYVEMSPTKAKGHYGDVGLGGVVSKPVADLRNKETKQNNLITPYHPKAGGKPENGETDLKMVSDNSKTSVDSELQIRHKRLESKARDAPRVGLTYGINFEDEKAEPLLNSFKKGDYAVNKQSVLKSREVRAADLFPSNTNRVSGPTTLIIADKSCADPHIAHETSCTKIDKQHQHHHNQQQQQQIQRQQQRQQRLQLSASKEKCHFPEGNGELDKPGQGACPVNSRRSAAPEIPVGMALMPSPITTRYHKPGTSRPSYRVPAHTNRPPLSAASASMTHVSLPLSAAKDPVETFPESLTSDRPAGPLTHNAGKSSPANILDQDSIDFGLRNLKVEGHGVSDHTDVVQRSESADQLPSFTVSGRASILQRKPDPGSCPTRTTTASSTSKESVCQPVHTYPTESKQHLPPRNKTKSNVHGNSSQEESTLRSHQENALLTKKENGVGTLEEGLSDANLRPRALMKPAPTKVMFVTYNHVQGRHADGRTNSEPMVKTITRRKAPLLNLFEYDSRGHRRSRIVIGRRKPGRQRKKEVSVRREGNGTTTSGANKRTKAKPARSPMPVYQQVASTEMIARLWKVVDDWRSLKKKSRPVVRNQSPMGNRRQESKTPLAKSFSSPDGFARRGVMPTPADRAKSLDVLPLAWASQEKKRAEEKEEEKRQEKRELKKEKQAEEADDTETTETTESVEYRRLGASPPHFRLSLTPDPCHHTPWPSGDTSMPAPRPPKNDLDIGTALIDDLHGSTIYVSTRPGNRMLHLSPPRVQAKVAPPSDNNKPPQPAKQHDWSLGTPSEFKKAIRLEASTDKDYIREREWMSSLSEGVNISANKNSTNHLRGNHIAHEIAATRRPTGRSQAVVARTTQKNSKRRRVSVTGNGGRAHVNKQNLSSGLYATALAECQRAAEKCRGLTPQAATEPGRYTCGATSGQGLIRPTSPTFKRRVAASTKKAGCSKTSATRQNGALKFSNPTPGQTSKRRRHKRCKVNRTAPGFRTTKRENVDNTATLALERMGLTVHQQQEESGGRPVSLRSGELASASDTKVLDRGPVSRLSPVLILSGGGGVDNDRTLSSLSLASASGESATLGFESCNNQPKVEEYVNRKLPLVRFGASLDQRFRQSGLP